MSKQVNMSARPKVTPSPDTWVESRQVPEVKSTTKPKRLTIDLDPQLHKALKLSCVKREIQIADLLRGLIEEDVKQAKELP
ncbi:hypothetical protein FF011L_12060 [Roseimaritima multifibrata]|uniref:ParG n=1 Tax=Roseimaritima multifibrata TaxID=1930274 RepID=A0A517MC54_9BACT|nr:hypothetical protein [Roseimaritima multifibrata]QDS92463.1 hypothetical protein FF011L_12060 [Roseimaritima multifibrata]